MSVINPEGYKYGGDPINVNPFWDDDPLVTHYITASATVDDSTGTPSVEVIRTEEDEDINFEFNFHNLKGETGAQGPQGIQGEKGDTGEQGPAGATGPQGPKGDTGARGPQGIQGEKGDTGEQGPTGATGPQGPKGDTGATGETGATGPQGPAGADGVTPVISATATADAMHSATPTVTVTKSGTDAAPEFAFAFSGLQGEQGPQGIQGIQGPQGEQGATGPKGDTGDTGATGQQGPQGIQGPAGSDGVTPVISATATADALHSATPTVTVTKSGTDAAPSFAFAFSGLQGEQGPQGIQGIQGPQGAQGETGPQGEQGPQGIQGIQGVQGPQGETGAQGATGPAGPGVPTGGTAGQVLSKVDGTDYNTAWTNPPTSGLVQFTGTAAELLSGLRNGTYKRAVMIQTGFPYTPNHIAISTPTDLIMMWHQSGANSATPTAAYIGNFKLEIEGASNADRLYASFKNFTFKLSTSNNVYGCYVEVGFDGTKQILFKPTGAIIFNAWSASSASLWISPIFLTDVTTSTSPYRYKPTYEMNLPYYKVSFSTLFGDSTVTTYVE